MTTSSKTRKGAGGATESGLRKRAPLLAVLIFLLFVGIFLAFFAKDFVFFGSSKAIDPACSDSNMYISDVSKQLYSKSEKTFDIEYAKTPSQLELGLSRRTCIPKHAAMIFLFPTEDKFGIWMKDMNFPIDVLWLTKDKKVVHIEKAMQPSSYPKVFYPSQDALYVIEMASGQVDELGVGIGEVLSW